MDNNFRLILQTQADLSKAKADVKKYTEQASKEYIKLNVDVKGFSRDITNIQKQVESFAKTQKSLLSSSGEEYSKWWEKHAKNSSYYKELEKQARARKKMMLDEIQAYKINTQMKIKEEQKLNAAQILSSKKIQLDNRIGSYIKNNTKLSNDFVEKLKQIQVELKTADKVKFTQLQNEFREVSSQAELLGQTGNTFFTKLGKNVQQFLGFLGSASVVMQAVNAVKSMTNTIFEADGALTNLRMVTGDSIEATQELITQYNKLGQELGATTIEITTSANEFLRQGKTVEETNELIRNAMILSKIAQLGSAEATQYLTSAMLGYKLETEETLDVVSRLSAVDMVSATSAGGLAEGMSRTAASAKLAGVEMDKLLGYLAVVGEVTQKEMSTIGESFKTIFSRMGNVKLGKLVDEDGNDITTEINDVEKILGKVQLKLRDSANSFRDFDDVLDDVGKNWGKFSEVEQNAIATTFAGIRQRENFIVLMENYSNALKYTQVSAESSGTAMKKFEIYQQSLEARTKMLTSAFEELALSTLNSDLFKGLLDGAIGLTNGLSGVIEQFGLLPTLIGASTLAFGLFGKQVGVFKSTSTTLSLFGKNIIDLSNSINKMNDSTVSTVSNYTKLNNAFRNYNINLSASTKHQTAYVNAISQQNESLGKYLTGLNGAKASMGGYIGSLISAKAATIGLQVASTALNMALSMGIAFAIQGIISAISNFTNAQDRLLEQSTELTKAYQEEQATLDEQINKYKELSKELQSANLSVDDSRTIKEQLITIQNSLNSAYGDEASKIDLVNGKYEEQLGLLGKISKDKAEKYLAENKSGYNNDLEYLNEETSFPVTSAGGIELDKEIQKYLEAYKSISMSDLGQRSVLLGGQFSINVQGTREQAQKDLTKLFNDLAKDFGKDNPAIQGLQREISDALNSEFDDEKIQQAKDNINEYIEAQVIANDKTRKIYSDSITAVENYNAALIKGEGVEEATKNLDLMKQKAKDVSEEIQGSDSIFKSVFDNIAKASTEAKDAVDEGLLSPSTVAEQQTQVLDDFQSKLSSITNTLKDVDKIDPSTLIDLIQANPSADWESYKNGTKSLADVLQGSLLSTLKELKTQFPELASMLDQIFNQAFSQSEYNVQSVVDELESLEEVLTRVQSGQSLSIDEMSKLINKYGELGDAVLITSDGYSIEVDALTSLINKQVSSANTGIAAEIQRTKATIEQTKARLGAYAQEASALAALANSLNLAGGQTIEYLQKYGSVVAAQKYGEAYNKNQKSVDALINLQKQLQSLYKGFNATAPKSSKASGGGSDKSKSGDTKEQRTIIDYAERKLNVLASLMDTIKKKASSIYSTFKDQNKELDKALSNLKSQQKAQEDAYKLYVARANKIKLDSSTKSKIQNGSINISEYSQATADKITEYQKWYDKAQDIKATLVDIQIAEKELSKQKITNVIDDYDRKKSYENALISLKEAQASASGKTDFNYLIGKQGDIKKILQSEYKDVETEFNKLLKNGTISKYSDDWYEYKEILAGISAEISNCDEAMNSFKEQLVAVRWKPFEDGITKLNNLKSEISDTMGLLSGDNVDANGNLTKTGLTNVALNLEGINNSKQIIADYNGAITKLKEDLKNGNISQDQYNQKLVEFQDAIRQSALDIKGYETSIKDLRKNAIEAQTEAMRESISTLKEELQAEKDLHDYKNSISDKENDITKLQNKINGLRNSTDRKDIALRLSLEEDLAEAQEELAKQQADHAFDEQMKGLDKELNAYEESQNKKLEDLENNLTAQETAIKNYLNEVKNNYSTIYQNLSAISKDYSLSLTSALTSPWASAKKAAEEYAKYISTTKVSSGTSGIKTTSVKGYATGTNRVLKDELAWTQEYGDEMIISPSRNAILTPLKMGDPVLTPALTKNLVGWANLKPPTSLQNFSRIQQSNTPIVIEYNSPLVALSGLTKDEINNETLRQINQSQKDLIKVLNQYGVRR